MRIGTLALAVLTLGLLASATWGALTETVVVNVDALVASAANLTIGATTINFPDADPDTTPVVPAQQNPVVVTASAQTGSKKVVDLSVMAAGDLTSGSNTIPITNVSWIATGSGYLPGTMSRTSPQPAGNWQGHGTRNGTFSYFLVNSWAYKTGNYTATATYTLTVP
ncbi:MAG: hypothetical protein FJ134_00510 [Deltaproteobacteria bacterium]|nr:hypothetical protein [Deltaproteobacteria bacterium]